MSGQFIKVHEVLIKVTAPNSNIVFFLGKYKIINLVMIFHRFVVTAKNKRILLYSEALNITL
jgi:hypothetical protein